MCAIIVECDLFVQRYIYYIRCNSIPILYWHRSKIISEMARSELQLYKCNSQLIRWLDWFKMINGITYTILHFGTRMLEWCFQSIYFYYGMIAFIQTLPRSFDNVDSTYAERVIGSEVILMDHKRISKAFWPLLHFICNDIASDLV